MVGVLSGLVAMPYSVYLGSKARKQPSLRSQYVRRIALLPTIPLLMILYSGYNVETIVKDLSLKYFGHLSDQDLDNFELYYQMMRNPQF